MTKMTTCDLHNETIIRLKKRITELKRECRQQSAGVLVLASQRANYLERAEKAEAERDELARTIDLLNVERSKAETSLLECMAHADAMQAFIDDEEGGTTITLAYSQWKEGQHE